MQTMTEYWDMRASYLYPESDSFWLLVILIYPARIEDRDLDQCKRPLAIPTQTLTCSKSPLKPGAPGPLPLPSIYAGIKLHWSSLHPIWPPGGQIVFLSQLNFNDTDSLSAEICWGSKCFHLKWKVFQTFLDLI